MEHLEKKYFDTETKVNYWVLGYFGGPATNVRIANKTAEQYAHKVGVPIETVYITTIEQSSRYKGFKIMWSDYENQSPEPESHAISGVLKWLYM